MNFLKEIREHLKDFETEMSDEIHKFIDHLHTKYQEPAPAVVAPPAPLAQTPEPTFTAAVSKPETPPAPVVDSVADVPAPVVAAPVIAEVKPTAVVEPTTPAVEDTTVENSKKAS
jgi:hypothetical protein